MQLAYAKAGFFLKWFKLKIVAKRAFKKWHRVVPASFEELLQDIKRHQKIVVLASGPSANKLVPTPEAFYLVTNNSYKMVANFDFLYYIKDGYYVKRFLANGPYSVKHERTLFYWLNEKDSDVQSFKQFVKSQRLPAAHKFYFFSDLVNSAQAESEWNNLFRFITDTHKLPFKIQNSGVFLLLFGFYLAQKLNMPFEIYGLDLGAGGNVHFDGKGHLSDSITRDSIKKNVKMYLSEIYIVCGTRVKNYSNFYPN